MKYRQCVFSALVVCVLTSTAFPQGFFDKVKQAAGDVTKVAVQTVTAPTQTVLNTAKAATGQGSVNDIWAPYKQLGSSAGSAVGTVNQMVADPQRYLYQRIAGAATSIGGQPGSFVFDLATFGTQLQSEMLASGVNAFANTLQGQNPFQVVAAPLAAALRAARDRHAPFAKPLPEDVREGLKDHFPASTLARAKYTVGTVEITLPNFIGQGPKFMHKDAVVVDDIIVFASQPPSFEAGAEFWAHEVMHVRQYEQWGIEDFARRYVAGSGKVEDEARAKGASVVGKRYSGGLVVMASASTGNPQPMATSQGPLQNLGGDQERFIAQCIFPMDMNPVNYMVTSRGRIIAVNPFNGQWLHIGYAYPPLFPASQWRYQTQFFGYDVGYDGRIVTPVQVPGPWGPQVVEQQVGHVVRVE